MLNQHLKTFSEERLTKIPANGIFVFGSNTTGNHGKGAAYDAVKYHGAKLRQARGLQGNSYAIITKDLTKKNHPSRTSKQIITEIRGLYQIAQDCQHLDFYVTYQNKSTLNAYQPTELALMFVIAAKDYQYQIPKNFIFHQSFAQLIFDIQL